MLSLSSLLGEGRLVGRGAVICSSSLGGGLDVGRKLQLVMLQHSVLGMVSVIIVLVDAATCYCCGIRVVMMSRCSTVQSDAGFRAGYFSSCCNVQLSSVDVCTQFVSL